MKISAPNGDVLLAESSSKPRRSVWRRALCQADKLLRRLGINFARLEEQRLIEVACRRTGFSDFGDNAYREPLRRLLESYKSDAKLNCFSRLIAREDTIRLLSNRLLIEAERQRYPEIGEQEIRQPIFITGLPRTGTTLLHALLALDPAHRVPLTWETLYPSLPADPSKSSVDTRIRKADRQIRLFNRLTPEFKKIHQIGALLPEECLVICSYSFMSNQFETTHRVLSYLSWLKEQDLQPAYEWHRRILEHLQWRQPSKRWVLKAPAHLFGLEALLQVYPDAGVILTHRDPLVAVASNASLTVTLRRIFSDEVDRREVGIECSQRWSEGLYHALAVRDSGVVPSDRFADVYYNDLVRDPVATVQRIYRHFNLAFDDSHASRIREYLSRNPRHKHGKHRYSLAQFGLNQEQEMERFGAYRKRFKV
jgi:hypothetical protein